MSLGLIQTACELGLICSLVVIALFVSYTMLGACDLSTDSCFTLGAVAGGIVAISGHPLLAVLAALVCGALSGFITSFLQTRLNIDSLLAGIVVNSGLYSVNIFLMSGSSLLNMNKTRTIFTMFKELFENSFYKLILVFVIVLLVVLVLTFFFKTKLGLAIKATGSNVSMVKNSSIDPKFTTTVGLCLSGAICALSGCLLAFSQKSVSIDIGIGMLTIALASLLIGRTLGDRGSTFKRLCFAVVGSLIFRLIYMIALRLNMPAYMLKLVSSVIVILALCLGKVKGVKRVKTR